MSLNTTKSTKLHGMNWLVVIVFQNFRIIFWNFVSVCYINVTVVFGLPLHSNRSQSLHDFDLIVILN